MSDFIPTSPYTVSHYSDQITHPADVAALVAASDAAFATWAAAFGEWSDATTALPLAERADIAALRAAVVADKPTPKELAPPARDRLARSEVRCTLTRESADVAAQALAAALDRESENLVGPVLDHISGAAERYAESLTLANNIVTNAFQGLRTARSTAGLMLPAAKRAGLGDPRNRVESGVDSVTWPGSQPVIALTTNLDRIRSEFTRAARVTPAPSE